LIRRSLIIGFEIIATLIAGVAILVGFLGWRLADGHPVHLGFLVPYFERSLDAPDRTFRVKLDDLIVTWTGGKQLVSIRAIHVRALSQDGRELASVPQIGLRLSVRAMMHGLIAPTEVEIFNPRIHVRRNPDGKFQFLATVANASEGQSSTILPELFGDLMGPPDPSLSTGYLQRAHLVGGTLVFDDERTGLVWHAPKIDIHLSRDRKGMAGELSAQVVELGDPALLTMKFVYASAGRNITIESHYEGVDIASLGLIAPDLATLSSSHMQFAGSLDTTVNLDGHFSAVHFTVSSGPGQLDLPAYFDKPLAISGLALAGQLDTGFDALALETFTLDLGGPQLTASGNLSGLISQHSPRSGLLKFQGRVTVNDVPVPQLPHLWPVTGGDLDHPREWIVSEIDQGTVKEAEADFDVDFAGGEFASPSVRILKGKLKASGIGLHYLRPLPPIRGAEGTATFDATQFVADFASGGVDQLAIERGHLVISGLDKHEQIIDVAGDVKGPLKSVLLLLDNPRLGYPKKVGIDPAESAGTTETHLEFRFPAINNLAFERVQMTAAAKIQGARLGGVFLGHDLTEGDFDLKLDSRSIDASGKAKLAGIPAGLRWDLHFYGEDYVTRIALAADTNTEDLAHLGFDYRDVVNGPLRVDLVYTEFKDRLSDVSAEFDLAKTLAALEFAKWKKPPGEPGHASLRMTLDKKRPVAISAFTFQAGDLDGQGHGRFDADGKLAEATFDNVALGQTRLSAVTVGIVGERWDIAIGGGIFDAEPFVGKHKVGVEGTTAEPVPPVGEEKPTRAFTITAPHLDRVTVGRGRSIEAVRLKAAYDGLHWLNIEADGSLPGGKPLTLRWLPAAGASHQLSIAADDAGSALKLLDIVGNVVGGRLTITGASDDTDPKRPIKGHAEISEYRLVKQSALVRLLSIATLTGLLDVLTGEGFQMYKFIGDFTKTGGRIDIPLARTYGPSLGLTAAGFLDYDADKIDIRGTVVPAYALNSLIGQIPIVGYLLTGGEGTGLFAVVYNATGKLSEPTIIVNPLSMLAPGFLRGVFNMFPSGQGTPSALPPNFAPGKKN
jgi:hypothetical protein